MRCKECGRSLRGSSKSYIQLRTCKECRKEQVKQYQNNNPEKAWQTYQNNKIKVKQWSKENSERHRKLVLKWKKENPDKIREHNINGARKRISTMARSIYLSLKGKKNGRKWETFVNYNIKQLMIHLEVLFEPGMNWGNYGNRRHKGIRTWNIGHILPRALFYYEDADDSEFQECWALKNLKPEWEDENFSKNDKLPNGELGRNIRKMKMKK